MPNQDYPGIIERLKAVLADSLFLVFMMMAASYFFSSLSYVPDNARMIVFIFIVLLYDPILTSILGGTFGHYMMGLRVKRDKNKNKNIILPLALIRFVIKSSLGWVSLITVSGNSKKKAIHDYVAGSMVIYKNQKPSTHN